VLVANKAVTGKSILWHRMLTSVVTQGFRPVLDLIKL
jgi:hypothetical protein